MVNEKLWHVHLDDPRSSSTWDSLTENFHVRGFSQDNYTSDTILVYGRVWDVYRAPYLLQTILQPNGHDLMVDRAKMLALAMEFRVERSDYAAQMPSSDWLIVE
ncbi:hypothetical protein D3C78_1636440 [compost metagenome]